MPSQWRLVGFTGHRHLTNEPVVRAAINATLARLSSDGTSLAAVSSAAAGADTVFLEAAKELDLPAFVVLPFDRQQFREGFTAEQWKRAEPLIDASVESETASINGDREVGFIEAGVRTIDRADIVVAVWDGQPPKGPGGTGTMVRYARALNKPLIVIDPSTGQVSEERVPPRQPASFSMSWRSKDLRAAVSALYKEEDTRAAHIAPAARWLVFWIISLHLVATVVAVASVSLRLHGWPSVVASVLKLSALAFAIGLAWKHRAAHHGVMRYRMTAELCRSLLALWPLSRQGALLPRVPVPGFDALRKDLELSWRIDRSAVVPFDEARAAYLVRVRSQTDYFHEAHERAAELYRALRTTAVAATVAAIMSILGALVLPAFGGPEKLYSALKFLSIILPLANAAALSAILALDLGRRVERYRQMEQGLAVMQARVEHAYTWPTLWRAARDSEELLLYEAAEWLTVTRFAGGAH